MLNIKPKRREDFLGWQLSVFYLGGDPYNEGVAAVNLRVLEKALVIRSADREEDFVSLMIPYGLLIDMCVTDSEGKSVGNLACGISNKKTVCSGILVTYADNGDENTIHLRMPVAPDDRMNSDALKKLLEYVRHCQKMQK